MANHICDNGLSEITQGILTVETMIQLGKRLIDEDTQRKSEAVINSLGNVHKIMMFCLYTLIK